MSKIFHFDEVEDFFGGEVWSLQIDVTDLWNQYNEKKLDMRNFNINYHNRLLKYKTEINNLGNDIWDNLTPLLEKMKNETDDKKLTSIFDDIYNWADKNDILIKTN